MSFGYRLSAWLAEMLVESLLFIIVAIVMSHAGHPTTRDIAALMIAALTCFVILGYAVTTLVLRLALRGRWLRVYPIIAPLLFLLHFEIMNIMVPDGLMEPHNRLKFRVIGSGVVLVVSTAISFMLEQLGRSRPAIKSRNL